MEKLTIDSFLTLEGVTTFDLPKDYDIYVAVPTTFSVESASDSYGPMLANKGSRIQSLRLSAETMDDAFTKAREKDPTVSRNSWVVSPGENTIVGETISFHITFFKKSEED